MSGSSSTQPGLPDDLLKEKRLWAVYRASLRIPRSKVNISVALLFCIMTVVLTIGGSKASEIANQLHSMATIAFGATVSLLGFLIAGFSFFATVSDKKMFCRMAEFLHKESGLSYLKYNLFIFMRVFAEYLIVCIGSLGMILVLQPNSAARETVQSWMSDRSWPPWLQPPWAFDVAMLSLMLGVLVGLFVYILMELGSFIFNVYHVVMTSIKWEIVKELAEKEIELAEKQSQSTGP